MQQAEYALPEFSIRVQKTQITLSNRHAFTCVSFLAVRRKARIPQSFITVTFGLDHPLASARIDSQTEAYPGGWTHHLLISDAEELDSELLAWLHEAYELSARKRSVLQTGTAGSCSRQLIKIGGGSNDGCRPFSPALFNRVPYGIASRICLRPCAMLPCGLAAHTMLCTRKHRSVHS